MPAPVTITVRFPSTNNRANSWTHPRRGLLCFLEGVILSSNISPSSFIWVMDDRLDGGNVAKKIAFEGIQRWKD
jgi:hypothetical protein